MEMKQYLIDTFHFNDTINRNVLMKIGTLPEKDECVKYFSHLINSQNKWMARILHHPNVQQMSWWDPVYTFDNLESQWNTSLKQWLSFISSKTETQLFEDVIFTGYDNGRWTVPLKDIALQLNYHSIHHRAQIQMIIRRQGIEPDFVDYIGTVYRKLA